MSQRDGADGRGAPDSENLGGPTDTAAKGHAVSSAAAPVDVSAATMASGSLIPNGHADTLESIDVPIGATTGDESLVGETLGERYKMTRGIGKGGMGAVYEATDVKIGKRVAIKVLLDKYQEREQVVARLEQEARLASSIGHEHIIDITDFGRTVDGRTFVAMEYLEGESLGQLITRGPVEPSRAIDIARQISSALGAAHAKGIIHRDIKPDNVFLLQRKGRDFVKVVDFGISKSVVATDDGESPRLTQTGMVLGTPLYMSPEQSRGDDDLDSRIDLYAVGVILYEMVTGEVPFSGNNYLSVLSQVVSNDPIPPSERADIGQDLEAVILKAMAKDRGERYPSMAELDNDLALLQDSDPRASLPGLGITAARRRRPRSRVRAVWAIAGIAVIAAAVVFTVSMLMSDDEEQAPAAAVAMAPAPAVDAAPAEIPPDAAAIKPTVEVAEIQIVSVPPGATIYADGGGRVIGVAPAKFLTEKKQGELQLIAELKGHDDTSISISPLVYDGRTVRMRLRATKKGYQRRRLVGKKTAPKRNPGDKPTRNPGDKPNKPDGTAGGDLVEDPYGKLLGHDN